jgi:rhodanese-related sulfurtransferase
VKGQHYNVHNELTEVRENLYIKAAVVLRTVLGDIAKSQIQEVSLYRKVLLVCLHRHQQPVSLPIQGFVDYVESVFPDKDQPIYVLCATGHRSVQASNALAKYGHYTHVRNIWEGYNGQPKYAYTGNVPTTKPSLIALDLNNDGVVDGNDRDGWAFYQGLPTETRLKHKLLFKPYIDHY